jgi:hypothetical protein
MQKALFWCARPVGETTLSVEVQGPIASSRRRGGNDLVINVAIEKIIDCATGTPEENSSTSEECKHFQVREVPWHGGNRDGPAFKHESGCRAMGENHDEVMGAYTTCRATRVARSRWACRGERAWRTGAPLPGATCAPTIAPAEAACLAVHRKRMMMMMRWWRRVRSWWGGEACLEAGRMRSVGAGTRGG